MNRRRIRRVATLLPLLLAGCGPAAIGVALGSGGGGGGPGTPDSPTLITPSVPFQPEDQKTVLGVTVAQTNGRSVRVRLEYDLGQGRVRIPSARLVRYDLAARAPGVPLEVDAQDNFVVPTTAAGNRLYLLWDHLADLGQAERRNVSVYAVFADALRFAPDFTAAAANTVQLLANRTVGREVGTLSDLVLRRGSSDPESPLLVDATLTDRGGDRERTSWAFEYALTDSTPQEADFVSLPAQQPTSVTDVEQPDTSVRSTLTFTLDALQLGVPLGAYTKFWIRLQHREVYPGERDDQPSAVRLGAKALLDLANTQLGYAPRIDSASVINPGSAQASAGDPGRPWLRLPIAVVVTNPSPSRAMHVRLDGTYSLSGIDYPITPFLTGDPQSAQEFDLQPLEKRKQFLVWNVVRDEGLGILLVNAPPESTPVFADTVRITARRLPATGTTLAGGPLQSQANAGGTQLLTSPFVDFRDNLLPLASRVWSSGDKTTQATRDLFFTRRGPNTQETVIGLNQQFEPKQITPPPPLFDFYPAVTNGVYDIVATDFDPNVPDCLIWINGEFRYATWPSSAGVSLQTLGGVGSTLGQRGREAVTFELGTGASKHQVAVFHTWQESTSGGTKTVQVRLTYVVRNPLGVWSVQTGPIESFTINGTPSVNISAVGGEFDGNAATQEVVLGTAGSELGGAGGLLHRWSFALSGSPATVTLSARTALPPMPALPAGFSITQWLMTGWQDGAGARDGLVVARQMDRSGPFVRMIEPYVLRQTAAGGFAAAWTPLVQSPTQPLSSAIYPDVGANDLKRIFARDLDGAQGIEGSDLLLVSDRRNSTTNERFADVWLLSRARVDVWRRIIDDLQVLDPDTLQPIGGLGGQMDVPGFELVDVNGDRLLDLVTCERRLVTATPLPVPSPDAHFNYLASSLSGVAGKLRGLGGEAGIPQRRSILPGTIDANGDGYTDIITGGFLLLASLDGTFTQAASVVAGPQSRQRIEKLAMDGTTSRVECLVGDEANSTLNKVYRIDGIGGPPPYQITPWFPYSLGGAGEIMDIRPLTAPDSQTRQIKDLVGFVGNLSTGSLQRGRIDTTTSPPTVTASAVWTGTAAVPVGMALVRRTALPVGSSPEYSTAVQDIVVGDASNPSRLAVFESHTGYAQPPRFLTFPGETVVRIAEASVSGDAYEDLCVLTEQAGTYRIRIVEQDPNPTLGIGQPLAIREAARFAAPFASSAVRAFQFDRGTSPLAQGFLLIDDLGANARSEARLLRPLVDPAGLTMRMVRSPLDQAIDLPIDAVVGDADKDQLIEVVGGQRAATNGLQRLQTNIAPPGQ